MSYKYSKRRINLELLIYCSIPSVIRKYYRLSQQKIVGIQMDLLSFLKSSLIVNLTNRPCTRKVFEIMDDIFAVTFACLIG